MGDVSPQGEADIAYMAVAVDEARQVQWKQLLAFLLEGYKQG